MMGPATANQCTSLLSSGEMKVKVHHDVHVWIHVSYVFVVVGFFYIISQNIFNQDELH